MASTSKKREYDTPSREYFADPSVPGLPTFNHDWKPLEAALWVLWAAKDGAHIPSLSALNIAKILVQFLEVSITARGVANAFNRSKSKKLVHISKKGTTPLYSIMQPGKEHLIAESQSKAGSVQVFCFQPGKKYTSKSVLADQILAEITGQLSIVDPYCGPGTLDILARARIDNGRFLTRLSNLTQAQKGHFLRDLGDFKSEHPQIEFRDYPNPDIHDRYVVGVNSFAILGHSIKDMGGKESFVIVLDVESNQNIAQAIKESFNRRWRVATTL